MWADVGETASGASRSKTWSELADDLGSMWVETCNQIGSQTHIAAVNFTDKHVAIRLEVAGVIYQQGLLPPNEGSLVSSSVDSEFGRYKEEDRQFVGSSNFAAIKLPCGFCYYTVVAAFAEPFDEGWSEKGEPRRLHFVYGGSKVTVHYDALHRPPFATETSHPSGLRLVNRSAAETGRDELSEEIEETIDQTKAAIGELKEYVAPAVEKVKGAMKRASESIRERVSERGDFGASAHDEANMHTIDLVGAREGSNQNTFRPVSDPLDEFEAVEMHYEPIRSNTPDSDGF